MTVAESVLVTGFPGFRSSHLVRHLLAEPARRVVVVVREQDSSAVEPVLSQLGSGLSARLDILTGDLEAIDMGLSGAEVKALASCVSHIHHVSLPVDLASSGVSSTSPNVASMRETLEFARLCSGLRRMFIHSSVFVSGNREGLVLESELNAGQGFAFPGLEELAVAEQMARRLRGQLPLVVLRAAQVVGEPFAGRLTALDGLYRLILLVLMSPRELLELLPSSGDTRIHALGVNQWLHLVAQAESSKSVEGKTLHLTSSEQMTLRDAFHRILESRSNLLDEGFELPVIGRMFLKDPLLREQLQNMLYRPRAFLDMAYHNVLFDTRQAQECLSGGPKQEPGIDVDGLVRQVAKLARPSTGSMLPPPPR